MAWPGGRQRGGPNTPVSCVRGFGRAGADRWACSAAGPPRCSSGSSRRTCGHWRMSAGWSPRRGSGQGVAQAEGRPVPLQGSRGVHPVFPATYPSSPFTINRKRRLDGYQFFDFLSTKWAKKRGSVLESRIFFVEKSTFCSIFAVFGCLSCYNSKF